VLLGDHGPHRSGRVLRADRQLLTELDAAGVAYREASRRDRHIAAVFVPEDLELPEQSVETAAAAPVAGPLAEERGKA
jgi:hypothetical protein